MEDLKPGDRPLIVAHGKPDISHHYVLPHVEYGTAHNLPVVLYGQLRLGILTYLRDGPDDFFSMNLFIDELQNLLRHLGIIDGFDLLGHL